MNLVVAVMIQIMVFGNVDRVNGSCSSNLENSLFEDLLNMMRKLKGDNEVGQQHRNIPAFSVSLTHPKSLASGEVLKFNKVWTNIMEGYDMRTGVFTAPIEGVYQFSCSVYTVRDKTALVHLWKNQTKTVAIFPGYTGSNMGTLNIILGLKKNDKIYIKGRGNSYLFNETGNNYAMFSGYLIVA